MQIELVNITLYLTGKNAKREKQITVSFPGRTPLPPKIQTVSIPYLLQAQPALALQFLACYCGSTTMCRCNGNCVVPNHTDS